MKDLILLHGALGSKDQLLPLSEMLSTHFNCHLVNFSGHGDCPARGPFSIDLFAEDLREMILSQGLEGAPIFGYSMGGYVALKLKSEEPEIVGPIHTLGTKFQWDPETAAKEVKMLNAEVIKEKVPKFAAALEARHSAHGWENVLNDTAEMMVGLGSGDAVDWKAIDTLQFVRITIGSEDEMVSQQESQAVAEQIGAEYKVFEGMKHPIEKVDLEVLSQSIIAHCS